MPLYITKIRKKNNFLNVLLYTTKYFQCTITENHFNISIDCQTLNKSYFYKKNTMQRLFLTLFIFAQVSIAQNFDFIHVDQFGYLPNQSKVAVLSNPQIGYNSNLNYEAPSSLALKTAQSATTVDTFPVIAWNNNTIHEQSGDQGWWVDFSSITTPGNYYLYDATNDISSAIFTIDEAIYTNVMRAAGRMFYYNRCNETKEAPYAEGWEDGQNFNNPLQDYNARYIYDQGNATLEKDLSGGWFDAGDYNKYVTFTYSTLHDLLSAYEENPHAFNDNWNIPESNNNIPDVLDEIKWEIDWLLKMTNDDGSVHIKMGSRNYNENSASPPSNNTDGRYYGPTCTSASVSVASIYAHAAKVFANIPEFASYSATLIDKAISTYQYAKPFVLQNTLETNCDDGSIVAGDADMDIATQKEAFLTAAIYLFDITGVQEYQEYCVANIPDTDAINYTYWGPYDISVNTAMVHYTSLNGADNATKNLILNRLSSSVSNDYEGFFGFNDQDLYRAHIPSSSYHWGSNNPKAGYGNINRIAIDANSNPNEENNLNSYIDEVIHYFHGVNPQSLVYLTNMYAVGADYSANEMYHAWFSDGTIYDNALTSEKGPAPGFVVGGPNNSYSVSTMSPPYGQPDQKSYLDFNEGTTATRSWEITEPAIYYQASYIRLLANRVQADQTLSVNSIENTRFSIVPNPAKNNIVITNSAIGDTVSIYNTLGQIVKQITLESDTVAINDLTAGIYLINLLDQKSGNTQTEKLIIN